MTVTKIRSVTKRKRRCRALKAVDKIYQKSKLKTRQRNRTKSRGGNNTKKRQEADGLIEGGRESKTDDNTVDKEEMTCKIERDGIEGKILNRVEQEELRWSRPDVSSTLNMWLWLTFHLLPSDSIPPSSPCFSPFCQDVRVFVDTASRPSQPFLIF